MKILKKYAELISFMGLDTEEGSEEFANWRCPNKKCGLGISEEYICCPYCGQKVKFQKVETILKKQAQQNKKYMRFKW